MLQQFKRWRVEGRTPKMAGDLRTSSAWEIGPFELGEVGVLNRSMRQTLHSKGLALWWSLDFTWTTWLDIQVLNWDCCVILWYVVVLCSCVFLVSVFAPELVNVDNFFGCFTSLIGKQNRTWMEESCKLFHLICTLWFVWGALQFLGSPDGAWLWYGII